MSVYIELSPGAATRKLNSGRPWLSALQAVAASIGSTGTLATVSPPAIVTGAAGQGAGDLDRVEEVHDQRGAAGRDLDESRPLTAPLAVTSARRSNGGAARFAHATVTVTDWVVWVSTRV